MFELNLKSNWPFGTDFATELLDAITYVSNQSAPFKIETQGFSVYWAGTILRVDIKKAEVE
jgi:hypothetical protein